MRLNKKKELMHLSVTKALRKGGESAPLDCHGGRDL